MIFFRTGPSNYTVDGDKREDGLNVAKIGHFGVGGWCIYVSLKTRTIFLFLRVENEKNYYITRMLHVMARIHIHTYT